LALARHWLLRQVKAASIPDVHRSAIKRLPLNTVANVQPVHAAFAAGTSVLGTLAPFAAAQEARQKTGG